MEKSFSHYAHNAKQRCGGAAPTITKARYNTCKTPMLRVRRAKFWMLEDPLSSNLLALLSGSFYGTAGPDKKGRHDVRLDEGSTQEETKKRREWTQGGAGWGERRRKKWEGGGGVPKWRSKPRDKISLCVRMEAHGGPGQRIPSSRSHISRIPLSYFMLAPFLVHPTLQPCQRVYSRKSP